MRNPRASTRRESRLSRGFLFDARKALEIWPFQAVFGILLTSPTGFAAVGVLAR